MLKYKVASLDDVEEQFRSMYEESADGYTLKVDGVEDVSGLKSKNSELLGKLAREKEIREQLEADRRAAEEKRMQEKGEFESLYKSEREKFQQLQERYESERSERINQTREQFAMSLAVELSGALGDRQTALMKKELLQYVQMHDEGPYFELGGFKVDADSIRSKMRTELPFLCSGSGATGGQAPGNNGKAVNAGSNPWSKETFNLTEQARIIKEDPAKAESLKAQAKA